MGKKFTAFEENISERLGKEITSKSIKLPKEINISVTLEMEQDGFNKYGHNPVWVQKFRNLGEKELKGRIPKLAELLDKTAAMGALDKEVFQTLLERDSKRMADTLAEEFEKEIEQSIKDKAEYKKYKLKAVGQVGIGVAGIGLSVGIAVATGGASAPLTIVALSRASATILQNVTKLAIAAEGAEKIIKKELAVLTKIMVEQTKKSGSETAKEAALGAVSGILGIETPSLANCESHIEIYKQKITGLEKECEHLGKNIYAMMDANKKLEKQVEELKANKDKYGKAKKEMEKGEKELDGVLQKATALGERVGKAKERIGSYSEALDALKTGVHGWTKYVAAVSGFAFDLAANTGDLSGIIGSTLGAVEGAVQDVGSLLLDKA